MDVHESDCAVTNALAALQVRGWLEALGRDFDTLQIRLDERWRDLGEFLVSGE